MQLSIPRTSPPDALLLGGGLLALGVVSGAVAYAVHPLVAPAAVIGVLGGAVLLRRPDLGVLLMFAMVLFKPQALAGIFSINTAIAGLLAGLVFLYVTLGYDVDFLRSRQLIAFVLIALVMVVNWYFVGQVEARGSFEDFDLTGRSMYRLVFQSSMFLFTLVFIRTPRQLLALIGLFLVALFVTIPGALDKTYSPEVARTSAEAIRAAAVAGVQAAENANRLAFIALMGIALLWFALRQYGSTILRLVGVPAILVLVLTVFLSGSRSGVLNLGLLLVLLMIQTRVSPGRIVAVILLAAACLAIAYLLVPQPILNRVQTLAGIGDDAALKGAAESTARRVTIFFLGLRLFLEHPVMGVGIGNFRWMATDDPLFAGAAAHNAYLLTLAEGGVLLFAVYMLLFWWTARDLGWVTRMAVRLPEVGLQWLAFSMRTILVMLLTFSFFAEAWKEFYFVLILATTAVLVRIYRRAAATAPPATA